MDAKRLKLSSDRYQMKLHILKSVMLPAWRACCTVGHRYPHSI